MTSIGYCFDRYIPGERYISNTTVEERAALLKNKLWDYNQIITVKFLNGETWKRAWIKKVIKEQFADNIVQEIVFVEDNQDAIVRIDTESDVGSSSYVGTDNMYISDPEPTMYLDRLDAPGTKNTVGYFTYDYIQYEVPTNLERNGNTTGGTILHEFCHVMGMVHEHQNPINNPIIWNEPYVFQVVGGPPNNWDEQTIRTNILEKYDETQLNASSYDSDSVMVYYFPKEFTINNIESTLNSSLSQKDKTWLRYAFVGASNPTTSTTSTTSSEPTETIFEKVIGFFKNIFEKVIDVFKSIVDSIIPSSSTTSTSSEPNETIFEKVIGFFKNIFEKVIDVFKSIVDSIIPLTTSTSSEPNETIFEKVIGFFKTFLKK